MFWLYTLTLQIMANFYLKLTPINFFKFLHSFFLAFTILATFSNSLQITTQAQYGGTVSTVNNVKHSPGRYGNGIKLEDPYNCGGFKIYGYVEGGTRPYSVNLTLISGSRTINRIVIFDKDGQNWMSEVSYDSGNVNFIPKDTYTITSSARDANGSVATYTFSALIQPLKDCSTSNTTANSTNNTTSSNKNSATNVITNGTNETPKTGEVVKVVQTQLLRTGGFVQSNPVVFSSSLLLIALATSLWIKRPKNIYR